MRTISEITNEALNYVGKDLRRFAKELVAAGVHFGIAEGEARALESKALRDAVLPNPEQIADSYATLVYARAHGVAVKDVEPNDGLLQVRVLIADLVREARK